MPRGSRLACSFKWRSRIISSDRRSHWLWRDRGAVLRLAHFGTNALIFAQQGWIVAGPLFVPGLIIGAVRGPPEPRWKPAAIFVAVTLPYLFYLPFDHWETLRFLLPGLVPLTVVVADGLIHIARGAA